mmetsp:Transcript_23003/g.71722  ORF Transcript_23003/g.71722 Transcript_23003/m.71722 type:complete len:241 (-) Transcript_23003:102-824(-)
MQRCPQRAPLPAQPPSAELASEVRQLHELPPEGPVREDRRAPAALPDLPHGLQQRDAPVQHQAGDDNGSTAIQAHDAVHQQAAAALLAVLDEAEALVQVPRQQRVALRVLAADLQLLDAGGVLEGGRPAVQHRADAQRPEAFGVPRARGVAEVERGAGGVHAAGQERQAVGSLGAAGLRGEGRRNLVHVGLPAPQLALAELRPALGVRAARQQGRGEQPRARGGRRCPRLHCGQSGTSAA